MTEGFLRGWLTFDNKTQFSSFREDYLISYLERQLLADANKVKLGAISSIVGGHPSRQNVNVLSKDLKQHLELTLPYMAEKTTIRSNQNKAKLHDPAFWRSVLAKKKDDLAAKKDEPVDFVPLEPETVE